MWPNVDKEKTQPWFAPPPAADHCDEIIVVGAGIAGAASARVLAERGCKARVIEQAGVASGASGNPSAVLRPVLARDPRDPLSRFHSDAFAATVQRLQSLRSQGHVIAGAFDGVLHCHAQAQALRGPAEHTYLSAEQAKAQLGDAVQRDGVWLAGAGWVSPVDYCKALLSHPLIQVHTAQLHSLRFDGMVWRLLASDDSFIDSCENVVLANGWQLAQIAQAQALPVQPVTSQLLHFKGQHNAAGPKVPVVGSGTICPSPEGWIATAGHWHIPPDSRADAARNADILRQCDALWRMPAAADDATMRAAVRATSPDHLPIVGGVPDFSEAQQLYHDVHHGRPAHHYPEAPHLWGLYLMGALGGRGIGSAELCAQVLASQLFGEQHPWQMPLHPLRFLLRQLKRRRPEQ